METVKKLENLLGTGRVKTNINLSRYVTLKTNATASYFFEAQTRSDLIAARKAATELKLPFILIGGGSNLVLLESRIEALVVRNYYAQMELVDETDDYATIAVSSGYPMSLMVKTTIEKGLSGFEYHLGLPGTMGGAIYMNSKWTRPLTYTGDTLVLATLLTEDGTIKKVNHEYFQFAYDYSILQKTHEMVLEAEFRLKKMDPAVLKKRSQEALNYRKETQPFGIFSSGCFFRNISVADQKRNGLPTTSAGYLIDKSGLKGTKEGNYYVSSKHANFIINEGEGKPEDLQKLLKRIKDTIFETYDIKLQEEVIII